MRKTILALAILGTALGFVPSQAYTSRAVATKRVEFSAIPCSIMCGYGNLERGDDYACNDPMVPGSYDDHVVRVPSRANYMIFTATPSTDWDLFVCRSGKVMRYSATRYINVDGYTETIGMRVRPGTSYRLRAYNQRDTENLRAKVAFRYISW